jgi:sugar/nucleoside kinase (ribokinase family)
MMTGFGMGNLGIYGQQSWQREAQERDFKERLQRNLQNIGGSSPMSGFQAQYQTALGTPQESIVGGTTPFNLAVGARMGGATSAFGMMPQDQQGQSEWWNKFQSFQFPMMR